MAYKKADPSAKANEDRKTINPGLRSGSHSLTVITSKASSGQIRVRNSERKEIHTSHIRPISGDEPELLATQGYVGRKPLFDSHFADDLMLEVDRLIERGVIQPAPDRIVNGQPTEWIAIMGIMSGNGPGSEIFNESPLLWQLFQDLQAFGESFNGIREKLLATGRAKPEEVPAIASRGMEMNVNRVVGAPQARWSGLHLHRDMTRFVNSLQALGPDSVRHAAIRARALTVSGYARPVGADGNRRNDLGGALSFHLRPAARRAGDRDVFDVVAADHNTGAFFFPHTTHGVARMTPGGIRYSFQAFFPAMVEWNAIERRISAGELRRELEYQILTKRPAA
jgi:hypothetical protein